MSTSIVNATNTNVTSINVANFVTIKLSQDNYIIWREQVKGMTRCHKLLGFLTGKIQHLPLFKPVKKKQIVTDDEKSNKAIGVVTAESEEEEKTDEFLAWQQTDLVLCGLLIATLSPEVLGLAIRTETSKDLWDALEQEFARATLE